MKSIELKVAKENIGGRDTFLTTYDLLKSAINSSTKEGFNVDEMTKRLRLLNEVDKHKDLFEITDGKFDDAMLERKATLELEDADYTKLKELFKEMKWGVVSKTIIEIHNEFDK
jgi:transcriptional regulator